MDVTTLELSLVQALAEDIDAGLVTVQGKAGPHKPPRILASVLRELAEIAEQTGNVTKLD